MTNRIRRAIGRLACRVGWRRWPATHRALWWLYDRDWIRYYGYHPTEDGAWEVDEIDVCGGCWWWRWSD